MSFGDIMKEAGLYFKYGPIFREGLKAASANPKIMALFDAGKALVKEFGDPSDGGATLHETLVKHGVDTKKLAEEIHPVGPESSGNPDAFNAGSNNVSP